VLADGLPALTIHDLAAAYRRKIPPHELSVFCIMNMGGHDATLIESNVLYGGEIDLAIHSPLAKMMKWGFDNYLYFNKGHMPPDFALEMTDRLIRLFNEK